MRVGMRLTSILAAATLASVVQGGDTRPTIGDILSSCSTPAVLDAETNVWETHTLHPNIYYRNEVEQAIEAIKDVELRQRAAKVADIGTFIWMKTAKDIQDLAKVANEVPCDNILGLVLDSLPYKGSHAQNVHFDNATLVQYQVSYIDTIAEVIKASPNTSFAVIVEPRAFPSYFNESSASENLAKSYRDNVPYALKALNLPNIVTYLDIGNSNSMDWKHHRDVAAKEIKAIYQAAGDPSQFRGFATNVANFNSWDMLPGEFIAADDSRYIRPQNEQQFVRIISDALQKNGLPSRAANAIMDTSRNGVAGLRGSWDDWCNVDGAGLGPKPAPQTRDENLDAFIWAKHLGESDGSSDPSQFGYDTFCGKDDAFKPSPAAGQWHQGYFEMLVRNADPPF
ncbi:glycoside hydrolase family 6 protein [Hypoxylon crocopeplum]|nr:glycoside hydrolase family 6 protein [Hypoxylon crocopeplum]